MEFNSIEWLNLANEAEHTQKSVETEKITSAHSTKNKEQMLPVDVMVTVAMQTAFGHLVESFKNHPRVVQPAPNSEIVIQVLLKGQYRRIPIVDPEQFKAEMEQLAAEHEGTQASWQRAKLQLLVWLHRITN